MATLAKTQDALCVLPSAKRRTPAMMLYIGTGAHKHGHAHHGQERDQGKTTMSSTSQ